MTSLKDLKLYTTAEHDCSYLPGQRAKTLFIDPEFEIDNEFHTRLNEIGFRRSGAHIYRPHCDQCSACTPCRVLVNEFKAGRRFRRVMKKNQDLQVSPVQSIGKEEHYLLYKRYINTRHRDGDMFPASQDQYHSFLLTARKDTLFLEVRSEGELLAVMICDRLLNGLSAVFTFYDPDQAERSLGTFAILWQIEVARRLKLAYLYLGYWIKDCQKMNYKTQYRPIEILQSDGWTRYP
ncbi:MAG: arginyltransferase [Gammaproteobacteria bacterium]|nr:arginyltransferase [Gammaproteobacteria bacterium]|tara:strand:+ start:1263 stop:1970 length:708 start_codon:yes stop_codon:yes gene_type:complete